MTDSPQRAFYDRMRRAMGQKTLERLQKSKVLIVGLSGLGVEIAKNLILSGLSKVYLLDDQNVVWRDLSTSFYVTSHDIGSNRVESQLASLKKLNSFVSVEQVKGPFSKELLEKLDVDICVFTCEGDVKRKNVGIISLVEENKICRETKTKFLACETKGLFGAIFNDLGDEFEVFDLNGEPAAENNIVEIEKGNPTRIQVLQEDGKINHGLGIKDKVVFSHVGGGLGQRLNNLAHPLQVILGEGTSRYSFFVDLDTSEWTEEYEPQTGFVKQVKSTEMMSHKSLEDNLKNDFTPNIELYDLGKFGWGSSHIHPLFITLEDYRRENEGEEPRPYDEDDVEKFLALLKIKYPAFPALPYARKFCFGARGRVNPMATLIGGMASHEVLKAVSGKTTPLSQWFYLDALECLPNHDDTPNHPIMKPSSDQQQQQQQPPKVEEQKEELYRITKEDARPLNCRYDGQIMVFGKKFCEELMKKKIFMIGVGALGCEYLKNFAMMGIGCKKPVAFMTQEKDNNNKMKDEEENEGEGEEEKKIRPPQKQKKPTVVEGMITVTDMDGIEESNLNRQFLFREEHLGKMKSHSACEVVKQKMNPSMNLTSLAQKVSSDEDSITVFNDLFWNRQDLMICALDNLEARKYVDRMCCYHAKPMIDAGTEGTKGNTFCVIPNLTETYSSQPDPPQQAMPVCTVANFPYKPVHCIAWSKKKFSEMFVESASEVNKFLSSESKEEYFEKCQRGQNTVSRLKILKEIHTSLIVEKPISFDDCIRWARLKFEKYYHDDILQLLHSLPLDHRDKETGLLFWTEDKRPPVPQIFDEGNEMHRKYIESAANLRAYLYRLEGKTIEEYSGGYSKVLQDMKIPKFVPKENITIEDGRQGGGGDNNNTIKSIEEMEDEMKRIMIQLPSPKDFAGFELQPIHFEKDDDSNHHVSFITSSSNNRSLNYRIPTLSFFETKGIAGQIIPALITTTATITGFGMIELLKCLSSSIRPKTRQRNIESFRNSYLNLAICLCTQSEPSPPIKKGYRSSSDWNFIQIRKKRDISLKQFLSIFIETYKLQCTFFIVEDQIVFSNLSKEDNSEDLSLSKPLSKFIFKKLKKNKYRKGQMYIRIECEFIKHFSGERIEQKFPSIKYQFRGFKKKKKKKKGGVKKKKMDTSGD